MFKELITECYYLLTYTILSSGVSDARFQILPSMND